MENIRFDPTWNYIPRALLFYVVPLSLFAICLQLQDGWVGMSRDFWIPFIWGSTMPIYNIYFAKVRLWAFKDFHNRDCYIPTIAFFHASVWNLSILFWDSVLFAILSFWLTFCVFNFFTIKNELMCLYSVPVGKHRDGPQYPLMTYGPFWWSYMACSFALTHALANDSPFSIVFFSLAIMLPMQFHLNRKGAHENMKPDQIARVKKVAVIGAGWSGIYACKSLRQKGLEVHCFEAADHFGGIWRYWKAKNFLHASDFPLPADAHDFPHPSQMLDYVSDYVKHFDLMDCIHLRTRVLKARYENNQWRLLTQHRGSEPEVLVFDAVAVCTGLSQTTNWNPAKAPGPLTSYGVMALLGRFFSMINVEQVVRRYLISDVDSGKATPRKGPVGFDRLTLGSECFAEWPFLEYAPIDTRYMCVFDDENPSLAFIGFARPIVGSVSSLSELQSRWVAQVWSGETALPNKGWREITMFWDQRARRRLIADSSRLQVLVDHEVYATEIASFIGAQVRWFKLLITEPRTFLTVALSPWIACKYQLNSADPQSRAAALAAIEREFPDARDPAVKQARQLLLLFPLTLVLLGMALALLPLQAVAVLLAAFALAAAIFLRCADRPCRT